MKNKFIRNTIILSVVALVAIALPAVLISAGVINAYTAQIITLSGINAIMALSVNIICGITGQLSLGQAGFMAIGAYSTIIFTQTCHIPLVVSVVLAGVITALFGFLIGFPTLKLEGDYLAIVTLGFGEIIRVVLVNLKSITGGPNGKSFSTALCFNPTLAYVVVIGILILLIVLIQNFIRSTYGRAILAVREDEIAANSSGIPVFGYKMIGFVIASFVAGIGGALYICLIGFVKPEQASFNNSINYLIYVVLGGMGSTTGSVLAAFVLTYLQEFLRFLKNFRLLIYPVILIIVMLFRPQGLLGYKEVSFVKTFDWCRKKGNWQQLGGKIKGFFTKKSVKNNSVEVSASADSNDSAKGGN
ncbi:MAG: branched-chain amino acid ABC transporter permease [Treponema sp.]|nr:branched-chain amino acid ABC transporter permease [Treponema sp.]